MLRMRPAFDISKRISSDGRDAGKLAEERHDEIASALKAELVKYQA